MWSYLTDRFAVAHTHACLSRVSVSSCLSRDSVVPCRVAADAGEPAAQAAAGRQGGAGGRAHRAVADAAGAHDARREWAARRVASKSNRIESNRALCLAWVWDFASPAIPVLFVPVIQDCIPAGCALPTPRRSVLLLLPGCARLRRRRASRSSRCRTSCSRTRMPPTRRRTNCKSSTVSALSDCRVPRIVPAARCPVGTASVCVVSSLAACCSAVLLPTLCVTTIAAEVQQTKEELEKLRGEKEATERRIKLLEVRAGGAACSANPIRRLSITHRPVGFFLCPSLCLCCLMFPLDLGYLTILTVCCGVLLGRGSAGAQAAGERPHQDQDHAEAAQAGARGRAQRRKVHLQRSV